MSQGLHHYITAAGGRQQKRNYSLTKEQDSRSVEEYRGSFFLGAKGSTAKEIVGRYKLFPTTGRQFSTGTYLFRGKIISCEGKW